MPNHIHDMKCLFANGRFEWRKTQVWEPGGYLTWGNESVQFKSLKPECRENESEWFNSPLNENGWMPFTLKIYASIVPTNTAIAFRPIHKYFRHSFFQMLAEPFSGILFLYFNCYSNPEISTTIKKYERNGSMWDYAYFERYQQYDSQNTQQCIPQLRLINIENYIHASRNKFIRWTLHSQSQQRFHLAAANCESGGRCEANRDLSVCKWSLNTGMQSISFPVNVNVPAPRWIAPRSPNSTIQTRKWGLHWRMQWTRQSQHCPPQNVELIVPK